MASERVEEFGVKVDQSQDDEVRGTKRSAEPENVPAVCSANEWEHADLGDEGRKSKFLRLMGASKKEHHGRFVIGDKKLVNTSHGRSDEETKKLNSELEEQYRQGLELKMSGGSRRHTGLGFQGMDNNGGGTADAETRSVDSGLLAGEEKEESRDCDTVVPNESDDKEKVEEKLADDSENKASNDKAVASAMSGFVHGCSS